MSPLPGGAGTARAFPASAVVIVTTATPAAAAVTAAWSAVICSGVTGRADLPPLPPRPLSRTVPVLVLLQRHPPELSPVVIVRRTCLPPFGTSTVVVPLVRLIARLGTRSPADPDPPTCCPTAYPTEVTVPANGAVIVAPARSAVAELTCACATVIDAESATSCVLDAPAA